MIGFFVVWFGLAWLLGRKRDDRVVGMTFTPDTKRAGDDRVDRAIHSLSGDGLEIDGRCPLCSARVWPHEWADHVSACLAIEMALAADEGEALRWKGGGVPTHRQMTEEERLAWEEHEKWVQGQIWPGWGDNGGLGGGGGIACPPPDEDV